MASPEPSIVDPLLLLERTRRLLAQARDGASLMGQAAWRGVVEIFYGSDDLTHAAAIAYYALLSFLPFLLLSMSVFSSLAAGQFARGQVLEFVLRYFPEQPDFIEKNLDSFWQTRIRLGIGGGIALLWASQGVFGAISTAVNHAWAVERPRTFWGHRWFTLLMMGAAALLLFAALLILSTASIRGTHVVRAALQSVSGPRGPHRLGEPPAGVPDFRVRRRPDLLLRAEHEGAAAGRVARRHGDGAAVAGRLRGLLVVHAPLRARQRARLDRHRRVVPDLDLHLGRDSAVRRRVHGRRRADPA